LVSFVVVVVVDVPGTMASTTVMTASVVKVGERLQKNEEEEGLVVVEEPSSIASCATVV
jgi:hypothetical protein